MKIIRPVSVTGDGGFTRNSVGMYWDKNGVMKTAQPNMLRVSYDPTDLSAPPFALYEPATVNGIKSSSEFTNAEWGKTRVVIEYNTGLAPDGTVSADKIYADTSNSFHYLDQNVQGTYADGEIYTCSIHVKPQGGRNFKLEMFYAVGATGGHGVDFNLSAGTYTIRTPDVKSASITPLPNGWFRISMTSVVQYATDYPNRILMRCLLANNAGAGSYVGVAGEAFYLWGAQLEKGLKATSYFPTAPVFTSRSSVGTYFDATGTLLTAPANIARYSYNPANLVGEDDLLVEYGSTNFIRNNTMVGGGAGAFPTNWSGSLSSNGVTVTIVGVGVENGIEYLEVSYVGTATAASNFFLNTESFTQIPALLFQVWVGSLFLRTVSGSVPSSFLMSTSGRLVNGDSNEGTNIQVRPTNANLSSQRFSASTTLTGFNTERVGLYLHIGVASGENVNFTMRVGLPQLERSILSSPIKTTNAAVGRGADVVSFNQTRAADAIGTHGLQYSSILENDHPAWNAATAYAKGDRILDVASHKIYEAVSAVRGIVTLPIASPCRATMTVNNQPYVPAVGSPIKFSTTGALPTGVAAGTTYFVREVVGDTFTFATTTTNTAINASGTQSGVHTLNPQDNIGKAITNKSFWIDAGASNRYAPFDTFVQSQAKSLSEITFVVSSASYVDTVALLNLKASSATVSVSHLVDGLVFSQNVPLASSDGVIDNWYDYFSLGFNLKREALIEGIPKYGNILITVTLKGVVGQNVAIGAAIFGLSKDISVTRTGAEHGAKVGIQAFDTKKRDDFGNYTIVPRAFAKRADFTIYISNDELDGIMDLLTDIRSVPTLYLGSKKYNSTMVYGYYKSFDIDISYPQYSVCSIQLEGLT